MIIQIVLYKMYNTICITEKEIVHLWFIRKL
jgi:hypothetical protein